MPSVGYDLRLDQCRIAHAPYRCSSSTTIMGIPCQLFVSQESQHHKQAPLSSLFLDFHIPNNALTIFSPVFSPPSPPPPPPVFAARLPDLCNKISPLPTPFKKGNSSRKEQILNRNRQPSVQNHHAHNQHPTRPPLHHANHRPQIPDQKPRTHHQPHTHKHPIQHLQ